MYCKSVASCRMMNTLSGKNGAVLPLSTVARRNGSQEVVRLGVGLELEH